MSDKVKDIVRYSLTCGMVGVGGCLLMCVMVLLGFGHPNCEPTVQGYTCFWLTMWACVASAAAGSVPLACVLMWATRKAYRCFS